MQLTAVMLDAGHASTVSCLAVHDEGKCLYSGSTDGTVRVCAPKIMPSG